MLFHRLKVVEGVHFKGCSVERQYGFDVLISASWTTKFLSRNTRTEEFFLRLHFAGTTGTQHRDYSLPLVTRLKPEFGNFAWFLRIAL